MKVFLHLLYGIFANSTRHTHYVNRQYSPQRVENINNLQSFLLELSKGFSFVARQKQIRFDDDEFYIDLVFYNFVLKCFLLIDLKIGKLSHRDVGQMDGYVRLFEDRFKVEGDNPTIGLILCSDKSESVAKYSVLKESKQIFASKYLKFLPSEEELKIEITKERRYIEAALEETNLLLRPDLRRSSEFPGSRQSPNSAPHR